jgi:subtilisin family serine protease
MNANPDDGRAPEASGRTKRGGETTASRGAGKPIARRAGQYMIAPTDRNTAITALVQRLRELGVTEVVRTLDPRATACPPVAVVQMSSEKAAAVRAAAGGALIVEADPVLRAAAMTGIATKIPTLTPASVCAAVTAAVASPSGPGFTTTVQVLSEREEPIERAVVELVGQPWTAQGLTDGAGKVTLSLIGGLPATVTELLIKPRAGHWSLCRVNPELQADTVSTVTLRSLAQADEPGWGGRAMRFDQVPSEYRGDGVKIALIDSGVATSHRQLAHIKQGFEATRGADRSWSQDAAGHGTPCAGIIVASPDKPNGMRGYAPAAELHICRLPSDARCSDLVPALGYCVEAGIDIACIGFGCARGSAIVEQCIAAAKQSGMAVIAAAGSTGGPVQFPACSPQVLAVGAIGRTGTYPDDSFEAVLAEAALDRRSVPARSGLFVPPFSCAGPEIDICAPGVAVISCQSPDGYAVCDGTSLAAPHVAALAAVVLAHRSEFRREFSNRDARRVERLFQVLKETAQPLGDPLRTGAGLADAPRALGLQHQRRPFVSPLSLTLPELRDAMRFAGLAEGDIYEAAFPEPPRGPATVGHLQMSFVQTTPVFATDARADKRALREAMLLAGLSNSL